MALKASCFSSCSGLVRLGEGRGPSDSPEKILKFEVQGTAKSCILGGYLIDESCILYFM